MMQPAMHQMQPQNVSNYNQENAESKKSSGLLNELNNLTKKMKQADGFVTLPPPPPPMEIDMEVTPAEALVTPLKKRNNTNTPKPRTLDTKSSKPNQNKIGAKKDDSFNYPVFRPENDRQKRLKSMISHVSREYTEKAYHKRIIDRQT